MKEKMKRRVQLKHEVSDHGKIDRVVQKSMNREKDHYLNIINGGIFNSIKVFLRNVFRFFFQNETKHNMPYFGPVMPDLSGQNNSDKKWYKTHVPKSMRKGLTNRETTTLRRSIQRKRPKYI